MEGQERPTTDETLAEKCKRLQMELKNTVQRAQQFFEFLAYLKQMATQLRKLASERKLRISDLLGILPSTRYALGANNGWIMSRRSGSKSPYEIITQYIDGDDAERICDLKPWTDEYLQNIPWSVETESNLPYPALLSPVDAPPLIQEVLSTPHQLIIDRLELGGMDYLLVFSAPQSPDARAPFDSYHQSFLMTAVGLIQASFAVGDAMEREILEERWLETRKGDSRTAIAKAAQARLDLWLRQEAPSDEIPELPLELDETCADYIEYWRQKLALPSWRRRGVAGVLSERMKDIDEVIGFEPSKSKSIDETYVKINIGVDIEKSASQKTHGNGGKLLRVDSKCQRTIGAVARAFFWAEASLRYTSKDKEEKYREWIENGRRVLSSFAKRNKTLRRIFKENSND